MANKPVGTKKITSFGKDPNHGKRQIFMYNFTEEMQAKIIKAIQDIVASPDAQVLVQSQLPTENSNLAAASPQIGDKFVEFKAVGMHPGEGKEYYSVVLDVKRDLVTGVTTATVARQTKETSKLHASHRVRVDFGQEIK